MAFLFAALPVRGGFIGWACGGGDEQGGLVLCTTNGVDWFRQGVGQLGLAPLSGVAAVNGRHVWVVGDADDGVASIYYSANAGETWVRQGLDSLLPDQPLHKIWAVDQNVLWAVGVGGAVVVSDNGGDNWHDVSVPGYTNMLQGVAAVDQYTAWVSGEKNPDTGLAGLFYTENSGQTWMAQTNGVNADANHLLGLYALDEERVWAIGGHEVILVTTNAGARWETLVQGVQKDGNEICVLNDQRMWAANDSHVTWTTNGGNDWNSHNTADYTLDVSTPDGTNVWAVASGYYGGIIYHSPDGGATWTNQAESNAWTGLFTVEVQNKPEQRILHVDADSGSAEPPFDSWATAASNIQDAVEAAFEGDMVLVAPGLYDRGGAVAPNGKIVNRVMANKFITVMSEGDSDVTFIQGEGPDGYDAVRGAYLANGAQLIGFTVTNGHVMDHSQGLANDMYGGGILQEGPSLVSNCVLTGNSGSGALLTHSEKVAALGPPRMVHTVAKNNTGKTGGGIRVEVCGELRHCRILDNSSFGIGGGLDISASDPNYSVVLENCFIAGNRVLDEEGASGGGVYAYGYFSIRHCTIIENSATDLGGGLYAGGGFEAEAELLNTLIYNNTAPADPNVVVENVTARNCCSLPALPGEGNMDDDPMLLGIRNPHIAEGSPCRGAGTTNGIPEGATDIDGEPRVVAGQTDIGCDQFIGTNILGALTADIVAPYNAVLVDVPLEMAADIHGKALWQRWQIETNSGVRVLSNAVRVTQSWPVQGVYTVRLETADLDTTVATSLVVYVSESAEHYVSPDGGNVYPYTNWAMAATSLIHAIETCPAGGTLYVGTGTYFEADTVFIEKPLNLLGVGEASEIVVDGQRSFPCLYVNHPDAVISNLTLRNGWSPDQGGGAYLRDGFITHCHVVSNYAAVQGGGLMCWGDARVEWCWIEGNKAGKWGGGIMANERGAIRNCHIRNNVADNYGGGADISDQVRLENSFITGNRAFGGAGVHLDGGGIAQNCTIINNKAVDNGGGILHRFPDSGATYNCIVYHNEAPVGPNINFEVEMTGTVEYTCSWPLFGGIGNITNDPVLLGFDNPHIVFASPCKNTGSADYLPGLQRDIDDEDRLYEGLVDIGCDEFIGTNILGPLTVAIRGDLQVVANVEAEYFPDIEGKAWAYHWLVDEGGGVTNVYTNVFRLAHTWAAAGHYDVELHATNHSGGGTATVRVHVVEGGFTNYVSPAGAHVHPFTNWTDAATNVQAAIDACWVGGVVMVQTGVYAEGRTLELNKAISVMGVGDPEDCVFDGDMSYRVMNINHPHAVLTHITITGGEDEDAAGIYMLEGTVSNCVIAANACTILGGGIRCAGNSLLTDSTITGNTSENWPGGVFVSGNATVQRCLVEDNIAQGRGGGIYVDQGGTVSGCVIRANAATSGGGVYLHYSGTVTHSIIHSNAAANGAGVYLYWGGTVTHCDITWNWGQFDGGGLWFDFGGLVTDSRIQNNFADENAGAGGGAVLSGGGILRRCDVSSNVAARGAGVYSQYNAQNDGMIDSCHIHRNLAPEGWGDAMGAGVATYRNDVIRNCLIEHNTSGDLVGGLLLGKDGVAENCTIVHNTAGNRIGGVAVSAGAELRNCIVYHNTAPFAPNWDVDYGFTVTHSCTTPDSPGFENTITADPVFFGGGNYRLQTNSPCVNTGLNDDWMDDAMDLDRRARIQNAVVDIGAYESPHWGMYADVDGDGFTDWIEVNVLGTDPTNPDSFLGMKAGGVAAVGEGIVVRWQSVAGKLYNVDRAENLMEEPAFTNWMTGVVGLPDSTTVTDTTATAEGPYFYRVEM